jgi:hypothetical protein
MANKKISELPLAGTLDGTEKVEIVQSGTNKQTTTQDIADLGGGGGGGSIGGSSGSTDNALIRANGTGGATIQGSSVTVDDNGVITAPAGGGFSQTMSGGVRGYLGVANGGTKARRFQTLISQGAVGNGSSVTVGSSVFMADDGVTELEDVAGIIEYTVLLSKSDGSDSALKRHIVGYRKDGTADPVIVGSAASVFDVGNATPTISFSVSGNNIRVTINDNTSGGWNYTIWADVFISQ